MEIIPQYTNSAISILRFELAKDKPNCTSIQPTSACPPAPFTARDFSRLGQCASSSPSNSASCYPEHAVSSLAVVILLLVLITPTH